VKRLLYYGDTKLRGALARLRAARWRWMYPGTTIGRGSSIGSGCRLIIKAPGGSLQIGKGVRIKDGVSLEIFEGATIDLGDNVVLGRYSALAAHSHVSIGSDTLLAEHVSIRDHDHHDQIRSETVVDDVAIGRGVWLAAKVTVLRGSVIGDSAIIGANAVVRGTIPSAQVAVGVPAKVIRPVSADGPAD
jgi:acetyltransferase-like isoleucine patch superfamily enzyme